MRGNDSGYDSIDRGSDLRRDENERNMIISSGSGFGYDMDYAARERVYDY
jgi:hypothetical protein